MSTTNALLIAAVIAVAARYTASLDKSSGKFGTPYFRELFGVFMVAFFILALDTAQPLLAQRLAWLFLASVVLWYGPELLYRMTGEVVVTRRLGDR